MIRSRIGIDYEGISCIKITKGARDPLTIPDSEASAFHYNSKWAKDIKIDFISKIPPIAGDAHFPPGSNASNYTRATYASFNAKPRSSGTHISQGLVTTFHFLISRSGGHRTGTSSSSSEPERRAGRMISDGKPATTS